MSFMEYTFNIKYDGVKYAVDRDVYYHIQVQAYRLGLNCGEEFDGLWSYTFVIDDLHEHRERERVEKARKKRK